jgi:hypothetical protein
MTTSANAGVKEVFPGVYAIFRKIESGVWRGYDLSENYYQSEGDIKLDDGNQGMRKGDRILVLSQSRTFNDKSVNNHKRVKSGKKITAKRLRDVNRSLHLQIETHGLFTSLNSPGRRLRIWHPTNQEAVPLEKIDPPPKPIRDAKSYHCGR